VLQIILLLKYFLLFFFLKVKKIELIYKNVGTTRPLKK